MSKLQKAIGLPKTAKFTLADDEKEIYGNELNNILFRAFGNDAANISQQQRTLFLNDLASIRQEEVLRRRLRNFWNLSEERIEDVISIPIPDEFCAFSLKALKELLPDLKAGIDLNTILKVSHPQPPQAPIETLPLVDTSNLDLRNPVVHRVLTELRRVINVIISRYGKPDKIRIELARDLKATNKERERIAYKNREQEKIRAKAAEKIVKEVGISNPSKNDILKILLAEECNFVCPYSGETFELNDLFNGTLEIEHIIPYSRSFDDSFSNKTLCLRKYNLQKGNRSPYEAFGGSREYEDMLKRVSHFKGSYAERKLELFEAVEIDQEAFLSRNLNDTRYASKLAVQYLSCLYGGIVDKTGTQRIFATSGGCTALIRRAWGGNFLLGEGEKVRNDHRHHAIDALTIALTTPDLIKKIAALTPEQRRKRKEAKIFIDNELYQAAKEKLENIAVSHHQVNKLRGELHNETLYSHDFSDGQNERHVRVKLNALDCKTFSMIVDTEIQKLILEKLKVTDTKQLTDKMFSIFNDPQNYPTMKDRKGNIVNTIKAVRVKKTQKTKTIGKGNGKREVANGVNHILAIFAKLDAEGNEISWEGEIVSLLDAVLRSKNGLPLFDKNRLDRKFKFSLQKGDIVSWEKDGIEHLCVIRGISLPQFSCVPINDARMQKELKAAKMWFTPTLSAAFKGGMKKFTMNIFGELQRAND